jgi:hypothetical protein
MPDPSAIVVRAGPRALARLREGPLAPADIAAMPGAAGGPKGLTLIPLDRLLARHWLPRCPRIELVGASIGAWRMAALAQADAPAAVERLADAYVNGQSYRHRPSATEVSAVIRGVAQRVFDGRDPVPRPGVSLDVLTSRARGPLAGKRGRTAFARAALANAVGRHFLAGHLERVAFHAGEASRLDKPFDPFGLTRVELSAANRDDALTASGSIPLVCDPVVDVAGAPPGDYWDGGLIDYHLLLPHTRLDGVVLYPHFAPRVTPGWLDKFLPWRKHPVAHPWLDNMLLIAPSPAFVVTLPRARLPERQDFYHYGTDHASRIAAWTRAMRECERFADEAMAFLERPRMDEVRLL